MEHSQGKALKIMIKKVNHTVIIRCEIRIKRKVHKACLHREIYWQKEQHIVDE
jgi:hypothetical protein